MTNSAVIETVLYDALLPQNEKARSYVNQVLFGLTYSAQAGTHQSKDGQQLHKDKYNIRRATIDIFKENHHPTHDSLRPLIDLLVDVMPQHNVDYGKYQRDESHRNFLLKKFDALFDRINKEKDALLDKDLDLLRTVEYLLQDMPTFRDYLTHNQPPTYAFNYIEIVQRIWELVKSWQEVYEYLAAFLEHCEDWDDTPLERHHFQIACETIFASWNDEPNDVETDLIIFPSRLGTNVSQDVADEK